LSSEWLVGGVFLAVYLGMAIGRWPGLAIDRTGVAMTGAILLFAVGVMDGAAAIAAIDFATLAILFALMVLSAQFAASGFFDACAKAVTGARLGPRGLLLSVVLVSGGLSAVLTNDIVVWAVTPVLVGGLAARGLDSRPYVLALAAAANAGSAATLIGNPQNLLIGQAGELGFWAFVAVCGVPALVSLGLVHVAVAWVWRGRWQAGSSPAPAPGPTTALDRGAFAKALLAAIAVIAVFSLPVPRATGALVVAALLLLSRRLSTRRMLSMVDWHLLLLFASLFVVTAAFARLPALEAAMQALPFDLGHPAALALVSLAGSNGIGNVPLVTLLLSLDLGLGPEGLYALALFSTLSGNLLLVGSIANIIAVVRAREAGIEIGFLDHARIGVPLTLSSLAVAYAWLAFVRPLLA
jgi:Na+/H+ antiporter NhaD/arsenite permease-like protein